MVHLDYRACCSKTCCLWRVAAATCREPFGQLDEKSGEELGSFVERLESLYLQWGAHDFQLQVAQLQRYKPVFLTALAVQRQFILALKLEGTEAEQKVIGLVGTIAEQKESLEAFLQETQVQPGNATWVVEILRKQVDLNSAMQGHFQRKAATLYGACFRQFLDGIALQPADLPFPGDVADLHEWFATESCQTSATSLAKGALQEHHEALAVVQRMYSVQALQLFNCLFEVGNQISQAARFMLALPSWRVCMLHAPCDFQRSAWVEASVALVMHGPP